MVISGCELSVRLKLKLHRLKPDGIAERLSAAIFEFHTASSRLEVCNTTIGSFTNFRLKAVLQTYYESPQFERKTRIDSNPSSALVCSWR
jgi:hypothetical protein